MARRLRTQFPGATYHAINRGNDRRDLFISAPEAHASLTVLHEATSLMGWRLP